MKAGRFEYDESGKVVFVEDEKGPFLVWQQDSTTWINFEGVDTYIFDAIEGDPELELRFQYLVNARKTIPLWLRFVFHLLVIKIKKIFKSKS